MNAVSEVEFPIELTKVTRTAKPSKLGGAAKDTVVLVALPENVRDTLATAAIGSHVTPPSRVISQNDDVTLGVAIAELLNEAIPFTRRV